ncbi:hypothetical protein CLAN_1624 [Campylobacter lanienae NCTC 13004]|uniref:Uncharacterized protein n=1 Tax=Campylobacter lanienae NCTC 13004 TaxID=1031753 RepID=A0A1X9SPZ7_9BACT|nr:hypothetical protein [Campylobacter lanienae]ARQ98332.1 hypothetical protein CLAN_1624 [Campylobacter lanienae NCTC 13004]
MKEYQPQSLVQLKALVKDESVYLGDIDTNLIADMSSLFEPDVCLVAVIAPFLAGIIK